MGGRFVIRKADSARPRRHLRRAVQARGRSAHDPGGSHDPGWRLRRRPAVRAQRPRVGARVGHTLRVDPEAASTTPLSGARLRTVVVGGGASPRAGPRAARRARSQGRRAGPRRSPAPTRLPEAMQRVQHPSCSPHSRRGSNRPRGSPAGSRPRSRTPPRVPSAPRPPSTEAARGRRTTRGRRTCCRLARARSGGERGGGTTSCTESNGTVTRSGSRSGSAAPPGGAAPSGGTTFARIRVDDSVVVSARPTGTASHGEEGRTRSSRGPCRSRARASGPTPSRRCVR